MLKTFQKTTIRLEKIGIPSKLVVWPSCSLTLLSRVDKTSEILALLSDKRYSVHPVPTTVCSHYIFVTLIWLFQNKMNPILQTHYTSQFYLEDWSHLVILVSGLSLQFFSFLENGTMYAWDKIPNPKPHFLILNWGKKYIYI